MQAQWVIHPNKYSINMNVSKGIIFFLIEIGLVCHAEDLALKDAERIVNEARSPKWTNIVMSPESSRAEVKEALEELMRLGEPGLRAILQYTKRAIKDDSLWQHSDKLLDYFQHVEDKEVFMLLNEFASCGPSAAMRNALMIFKIRARQNAIGGSTTVSSNDPETILSTGEFLWDEDIIKSRTKLRDAYLIRKKIQHEVLEVLELIENTILDAKGNIEMPHHEDIIKLIEIESHPLTPEAMEMISKYTTLGDVIGMRPNLRGAQIIQEFEHLAKLVDPRSIWKMTMYAHSALKNNSLWLYSEIILDYFKNVQDRHVFFLLHNIAKCAPPATARKALTIIKLQIGQYWSVKGGWPYPIIPKDTSRPLKADDIFESRRLLKEWNSICIEDLRAISEVVELIDSQMLKAKRNAVPSGNKNANRLDVNEEIIKLIEMNSQPLDQDEEKNKNEDFKTDD